MNKSDRAALLSRWIKPSSDSEKDRQDRAQRMVAGAIGSDPVLSQTDLRIYAKGSYRNNTNVRLDSDVDIVVEFQGCVYYDFHTGVTPANPRPMPYSGDWTPTSWRAQVATALANAFGSTDVDTTGKVAIAIAEKSGSRPNTDVVPSFPYRLYTDTAMSTAATLHGSCVWTTENTKIVNWPQQQYDNGVTKNTETGGRYKSFARALKNAENLLAADGVIEALPSYFMECLVYNVDNAILSSGSNLDEGFRATLAEIYRRLSNESTDRMLEPNGIKYLFHASQKWTVAQGLGLVLATWTVLGYGDG